MLYYVFGMLIGCIMVGLLFKYALDWCEYDISGMLAFIAGMIGSVILLIAALALIPISMDWQGAKVKAGLINREYGTTYTQEEIFYASDVVDIVRELQRTRIEVNGDLRRDRDPQRDKYEPKDHR